MTSRRTLTTLSRIELMFQVTTRSATAHPICLGGRSEKKMKHGDRNRGNPMPQDPQKQRRPVGGEDRAPACQKRLGEIGPTGETGPF
jgi:hypothetical protein